VESTIGVQQWQATSPSQKRLLESPFFLDKAIQGGAVGANLADQIGRYFSGHVQLSDEQLNAASAGAYEMYRRSAGSRTFDLATLQMCTPGNVVEGMLHSGVIMSDDEGAHFAHHLFHDYLAARHLSRTPALWSYEAFNAISFNASSFDAISLVLQFLPPLHGDDFVRKVYDWNPYAAAYAISDLEGDQVSGDMKFVIAAMLAERLRDIFVRTVERSADALSILGTIEALNLRDADFSAVLSLQAPLHWILPCVFGARDVSGFRTLRYARRGYSFTT
jgi:hypothetical protein